MVVVLVGWVGFGRWKRIVRCTAVADWGAPPLQKMITSVGRL